MGGLLVSHAGSGPPRPVALRDDFPIEVLIGTVKGKLFYSRDSGANWESLAPPECGRYNSRIRSTVISSGTPSRIGVLVEDEGFFISNDLGQSWSSETSSALGKLISFIMKSRHDNRKLIALTRDRGVFLSDDGGTTWVRCEGFPPSEIFMAIAEPDHDATVVFAASVSCSVYRSADGGRTFNRVGGITLPTYEERKAHEEPTEDMATLVVCSSPGRPTALILGSSLGAYLSRDEGEIWEPLPAGILENNYHVNDLLLADSEARLLMATNKGLFYRQLVL